jgi:hypothetical protein
LSAGRRLKGTRVKKKRLYWAIVDQSAPLRTPLWFWEMGNGDGAPMLLCSATSSAPLIC